MKSVQKLKTVWLKRGRCHTTVKLVGQTLYGRLILMLHCSQLCCTVVSYVVL